MRLTRQQYGFGSIASGPADSGKGSTTWIQRWFIRLTRGYTRTQCLRHVETLSLGAKRSVVLIECDGERFLMTEGMSAPVALTQRRSAEEQG